MDKLDLWINSQEEDIINDISSLIKIPSIAKEDDEVLPYGQACIDALEQMLYLGEKYGFDTDNCDNYAGSISLGQGGRTIGIWVHLDVVAPGDGWIYPPFECTRIDDFIIGRGVQDNKGPSIAVLYALRYIKENYDIKNQISLIFGCNEENGMDDIEYYLKNRQAPDFSFVADSGFPVCHGEKGICRLYIKSGKLDGNIKFLEAGEALNIVPSKARAIIKIDDGEVEIEGVGISGHSAFPEETLNAVGVLTNKIKNLIIDEKEKAAIEFLQEISSVAYGEGLNIQCSDEVSGKLTCNVGMLTFKDGVITAGIDIRYPVSLSTDKILNNLTQVLQNNKWDILSFTDSPPSYVNKDNEDIKTLMQVYYEETKDKSEPFIMGGGTYARKIPNAVGFGPGLPMNFEVLKLETGHGACHSANEVQSISNLKKAIRIYVAAIKKLCEIN